MPIVAQGSPAMPRASLRSSRVIAQYTEEQAARVWKVRESGLGASVFVPGEKSGWEGWEDSAVPPEKLGAYLRELFIADPAVRLHHAHVRALRAGLRASAHQL